MLEIAADVSGSNKFTSRSLDGGANGLCTGSNCGERGGGVSGAMWFGPRLGRRRRSDEKTEGFDDDQINAIADALEGSPWNRVSMLGEIEIAFFHAIVATGCLITGSGSKVIFYEN